MSMRPIDDPARMTPDERFRAIARLLAAGLLRLRHAPRCPATGEHPGPEKPPEKLRELP
jgi:hypothetical protein